MGETFGKYELLRRIGVGGMGEVFVARAYGAEGFVKDVVIKRILPAFTEDADFVDMFIREARLAARLRHANIVQILDFDQVDGQYYIAMEWIDGPDLRRVQSTARRRGMPVPPVMAVHVGVETLKGLHYAHTRSDGGQDLGLVHRDISPHNLLVSFAGEVKIADFGVAKVAALASSTGAGVVKGKLTYMAPEQVKGTGVDQRSDLFSLGVVLWELLTGRRIYREDLSEGELIAAVQRSDIPPLEPPEGVELPEGLKDTVERLLHVEPAERYQRAADALSDLSRCALASEALGVSGYLHRLLPEEAERDKKGRTVAAERPTPRGARPTGPTEPTLTREGASGSGSLGALSGGTPRSDALERSQKGHLPASQTGSRSLRRADASLTPLLGGRRVGRRLVAVAGMLAFVGAVAMAFVWPGGDVQSSSAERVSPRGDGFVVIRNASPPGRVSVEGVELGSAAQQHVGAPDGTQLTIRARRGEQVAERRVEVQGRRTQSVSLDFGAAREAASHGKGEPESAGSSAGALAGRTEQGGEGGADRSGAEGAFERSSATPQRDGDKRSAGVTPHGSSSKRVSTRRRDKGRIDRSARRHARGSTWRRSPKRAKQGKPSASSNPSAATGTVSVIVYPWANVAIDGKSLGSTPLVRHRLVAGRHVVKLNNKELGRAENIVVTVSQGKTTTIRRNWFD
jgi:serine/threonine protein kinase